MIHMTSTGLDGRHRWSVVCRCGWQADGFETREIARATGNAHLDFVDAVRPVPPRRGPVRPGWRTSRY